MTVTRRCEEASFVPLDDTRVTHVCGVVPAALTGEENEGDGDGDGEGEGRSLGRVTMVEKVLVLREVRSL